MRALNHPSPRPRARVSSLGRDLFAPLSNMRPIVAALHGLLRGFAGIGPVSAEMFLRRILDWGPLDYDLIQCRLQEFHVVDMGSAGDYRQRDSMCVDK